LGDHIKIMVWVGHVAHMRRGAYRVLFGKQVEERPFGRLGVPGKIILKRIFKKWNGEA
jgi:hypothetical protein